MTDFSRQVGQWQVFYATIMAGMIMLLVSATRSSWFFLMDLQEK